MSQEITLGVVPSQTLTINLNNQACLIELRTLGLDADAHLFFSLTLAGTPIVTTRVCRNLQRLLVDAQYRGFQGDFMFIDTQGDTDPVYTGFGSRYVLVYIPPDELPAP